MVTSCVILATGEESRMKSAIPTALHMLSGKRLIHYAMDAVKDICERTTVLFIGEGAGEIQHTIGDQVQFVSLDQSSGTGQALLQAEDTLRGKSDLILITSTDQPLLSSETIAKLVNEQLSNKGPITMLTFYGENQDGYGRVVRGGEGNITEIVGEDQASTQELDAGVYCFNADWLWENLPQLQFSSNEVNELTELIRRAVNNGQSVRAIKLNNPHEAIRIQDRTALAKVEALLKSKINEEWMLTGVTLIDPDRTYIDRGVNIGRDTTIYPDTYLQGDCTIGEGCSVGPNSIIRDSSVGNRCTVLSSFVEGAIIEDDVDIGPFSHMREGAHLAQGVHVGNFGEVKNSYLGPETKMGHFSYIGDATIGANVNIGAGTITCNFDGVKKNPTLIEDDVFLGSDTMLVAPVKLEKGSRTGAGSVVTKDVPEYTIVAGVPARAVRKLEKND